MEIQVKAATKTIRTFTQKKVTKWIRSLGNSAQSLKAVRIDVDRIGQGHDVGCSIELETHQQRFKHFYSAHDLNEAVVQCLNQCLGKLTQSLVPVPVPA